MVSGSVTEPAAGSNGGRRRSVFVAASATGVGVIVCLASYLCAFSINSDHPSLEVTVSLSRGALDCWICRPPTPADSHGGGPLSVKFEPGGRPLYEDSRHLGFGYVRLIEADIGQSPTPVHGVLLPA